MTSTAVFLRTDINDLSTSSTTADLLLQQGEKQRYSPLKLLQFNLNQRSAGSSASSVWPSRAPG